MRRPTYDPQSLGEDIVISERTHAASNEDPDVAPSCETLPPDTKQVIHASPCLSKVLFDLSLQRINARLPLDCGQCKLC